MTVQELIDNLNKCKYSEAILLFDAADEVYGLCRYHINVDDETNMLYFIRCNRDNYNSVGKLKIILQKYNPDYQVAVIMGNKIYLDLEFDIDPGNETSYVYLESGY